MSDSIIDLISKRVSWRTFTNDSLEACCEEELISFASSLKAGPFGNVFRPVLLTARAGKIYNNLGSYGTIRGATDYFVAPIDVGAGNLEDFGFLVEQVVLKATALNIGSCWLGGAFTKKTFSTAVSLQHNEIIPAVIALGQPRIKRGLVDSLIRMGARSKNRKDFNSLFFWKDFGQEIPADYSLFQALEMVRLAPSASNQQPWRVIANTEGVHFFLKRGDKYQKTLKRFKLFDLQRVDMGIAMAHFDLAARELGFSGKFAQDGCKFSDIPSCGEYVMSWFLNHK